MPEVRFKIRRPDRREKCCYSPSTALHLHLSAGATYPLPEFLARAGLTVASERVVAQFGDACASALSQLGRVEARAATQPQDGQVT